MTLTALALRLPSPILDALNARGVTAAEILAALYEVLDQWLCGEVEEAASIVNPGDLLEELGSASGIDAEDVLVEVGVLADMERVRERSRVCKAAGYDVEPLDFILAAIARALGYRPMRLETVSVTPHEFTPGV